MINKMILISLLTVGPSFAASCESCPDKLSNIEQTKPNPVEQALQQLNAKTADLKTYQCKIEYLLSQPLFESQTLRKGVLYYQRSDKDSKLRINFDTVKYDDAKQETEKLQYIFEGNWLTILDYQNKTHQRRQLARDDDPNKPKDAFEMVSNNFPLLGFTKIDDLKKQFEIKLVEQKNKDPKLIQLHLKVKPDSIYKDDYEYLNFWIDKKLSLPAKIIATTLEKEIYQINLIKPKINRTLNDKIFKIKTPKGFAKPEIFPL